MAAKRAKDVQRELELMQEVHAPEEKPAQLPVAVGSSDTTQSFLFSSARCCGLRFQIETFAVFWLSVSAFSTEKEIWSHPGYCGPDGHNGVILVQCRV